jgi:hypothetical protein
MSVSKSTSEHNRTPSSAKIEVIAIRRIDKGTVRTIADVGLGLSLTLKEFKVIQQPGQLAWVSLQAVSGRAPMASGTSLR